MTYNTHVSLMFHPPTFMASLSFPPSHPRFPPPAVLHILCAVGSMYTAAVDKIPHPSSDFSPCEFWFSFSTFGVGRETRVYIEIGCALTCLHLGEIFTEKYRLMENRPESFPELQAKYASQCIDTMRALGINLFQCTQGKNISDKWLKQEIDSPSADNSSNTSCLVVLG